MSELAACTIVTKKYLAYARTLARTLVKHNPGSRFYVLLADRVDGYFDPAKEPYDLILPADLGDSSLVEKMFFYYSPFEICCGLRGLLHEYMMNNTSARMWLFMDSDIMVCHPLDVVMKQLDNASILLCPHCTTPVESQYVQLHEINLLRAGLYNAGIVGLHRTDEARAFVLWFKDRLQLFAFQDPSQVQYGDQLWLNFVPLFFKDVTLLTHPGANLAYWNLYERDLKETETGSLVVNGQPLLFVHFSGWDIRVPERLTTWKTMYEGKTFPLIERLGKIYRKRLIFNGHEVTKDYPYAFSNFDSGEPITPAMRRTYFDDLMRGKSCEGSPFANYSFFQSRLRAEDVRPPLRHIVERVAKPLMRFLRNSST